MALPDLCVVNYEHVITEIRHESIPRLDKNNEDQCCASQLPPRAVGYTRWVFRDDRGWVGARTTCCIRVVIYMKLVGHWSSTSRYRYGDGDDCDDGDHRRVVSRQ
ncbi:uncharacterized protein LOC115033858 [Acyrthosiphon pisum]|uniref:Uncharacterized protein n=1 Tax=Acyrthosiphon pisum TaxID=7029 RepID=A0A8R2JQS4_ACYPI|nr:uncharacterized protein LOC115033858 [Acyrthosiphon pisum]